jgi:hypothetical protein
MDLWQEGELRAGVIESIDEDEEKVHVGRTKDEIKNPPEFDEGLASDVAYRDCLGSDYGSGSGRYGVGDEAF